ncbi:hypothetical protein ACFXPY_28535, partial [Streptomyces sp. NPDC059153]
SKARKATFPRATSETYAGAAHQTPGPPRARGAPRAPGAARAAVSRSAAPFAEPQQYELARRCDPRIAHTTLRPTLGAHELDELGYRAELLTVEPTTNSGRHAGASVAAVLSAPPARITGGPSPRRRYAIEVPSRERVLSMCGLTAMLRKGHRFGREFFEILQFPG